MRIFAIKRIISTLMKTPFIYNKGRLLATLTVAVVAAMVLLPFIGLTDFNSKGEPREAVVAVSMLNERNFILPENNGGDIPYKPPFFHFCIALVSLVGGGVSEFTSRLPSALSLVAMVAGCFAFFMKRKSLLVAAVAAALTMTAFEVHRAGMNCRVDMMLTAFIVGALLTMYRWHERGARGLPLWSIVCMSGAVLTKGPVGFVLPCLVVGVFMLLRGERLGKAFLTMAASGVLACIVPLLWYVAAYNEGGERFLDLVIEENFGRMTGTMSYESHVHPFTYNFITLISGYLPWTLLLLFGLFVVPWSRLKEGFRGGKTAFNIKSLIQKIRSKDALQVFVWTALTVVFVFYCLPSSKRSVYLLPCYPFLAYLIAEFIVWLSAAKRAVVLRSFALTMAAITTLLTIVFIVVRAGFVPEELFTGRHAAENRAMLRALQTVELLPWRLLLVALPLVAAAYSLRVCTSERLRQSRQHLLAAMFSVVFALFIAVDGVYQPAVMNTKSLRPAAEMIRQTFPNEPLYAYISVPMMHFFGANFYLGDSIKQFENVCDEGGKKTIRTPNSGVLIIAEGDSETLTKRYPHYRFQLVKTLTGRPTELKDNVRFYRFSRLSMK